ncbi:LysR family transcriptional regulator [Aerococcus christensenii]|uniref:LysR family transcriptional regulator n=1 Tax=Aerococcus christensenii TaxID=87541 RepID=UPI0007632DE2|nr:LysR family transcriptional regulator [Aerococcus christensenii]AMB91868.1 hypothetical protein AWM71_00200 [Aerococcus christensenii]
MSNITPLVLMETIVSEGNITAAAEKLYVSQPYLSKMLSRLESKYGLIFFQRLPRSVQITYAGEQFLKHLRKINDIEEDMVNEFDKIANHKKGKIKLGINPALGSSILPLIIPPFLKKYPDILFEFYEDDADSIDHLIENHVIDLSFGMAPIDRTDLFHHYIYTDEMHLIIPDTNPLYNRKYGAYTTMFPYELDVLNNLPLVLLPNKYGIRRLIDIFFARKHLSQKVILEPETIYSAVGLARKGLGATFVPVTGMHWPSFNRCNVFTFNSDIFKCDYVFTIRKDHVLSPTLQEFISDSTRILSELSKDFRFNIKSNH